MPAPFNEYIIMIIWIASYPKSGNTYLRSFLASYYFSKDGKFSFEHLLKIHQFPNMKFSKTKTASQEEASKNWIFNQNFFFNKKNLNLVKTHNCLSPFKGNEFTTKNETLGAIYIVRDPRNIITSLTHHYSLDYNEAFKHMINSESSLLEKSHELDHSNFTYLGSWSNHYKSWKNNFNFKVLFIRYEDLQTAKENTFEKIILFINQLTNRDLKIDESKFLNSIKSTNFSNLKNKEFNEGFEESVYSNKIGKKINFFNLGFNNRWQKLLPTDIKNLLNKHYINELKELDYFNG